MTRGRSEVFPSAGTRRRAAALGVDVGLMDAVDAMRPRLSVEGWRALAARAGRPVEDVMKDELMPTHGLGMQAWEGGEADDAYPPLTQKDAYKGPEWVDDAPPSTHEQREARA